MEWFFSITLTEIFQKLKILGEYLHGLYAIPLVGFAIWQWVRAKFWKRKTVKAESHLNRVLKAADQRDEESVWSFSEPRAPYGYRERKGGLGVPIIAIGNLKGGVGKTTTSAYLSHYLSQMGLRVLAIDLDYQGTLSDLLLQGAKQSEDSSGVNDLLSNPDHQVIFADEIITQIDRDRGKLSLITASSKLSALENRLQLRWLLDKDPDDVRYRLAKQLMLEKVRSEYDVIVIDTPPRMTTGAFNAFTACSDVLIPTPLKDASSKRVANFYRLLKTIKGEYNPNLEVQGIILTLTQRSTSLTSPEEQKKIQLKARLSAQNIHCSIFNQHVPRLNSFADANFFVDPESTYRILTEEVWSKVSRLQREAA